MVEKKKETFLFLLTYMYTNSYAMYRPYKKRSEKRDGWSSFSLPLSGVLVVRMIKIGSLMVGEFTLYLLTFI